jgi:molybdopterin-containing oxidoreductase family iron-sulfur binding subunit
MPDYNALPLSRVEYNNKNHPAGHGDHGAGEHAPEHDHVGEKKGHG